MKTINIESFKAFIGESVFREEFKLQVELYLEQKYKKVKKEKVIKEKVIKEKVYHKNIHRLYKDKVFIKEFNCPIKEISKFIEGFYSIKMSYTDVYLLSLKYKVKNEKLREKNRLLHSGLEIEKIKK